jgi:hypothetical protein
MGARVGARARRDDTRRREAHANGERSNGTDRIGSDRERASDRAGTRNEGSIDVDVDEDL